MTRDTRETELSAIFEEMGSIELRKPETRPELQDTMQMSLDLVGRYGLICLLGRGGMGQVMSANDPVLNRQVAVKLLRRSKQGDPSLVRRFICEAQVTAQLEHPNIVPIYDLGSGEKGQLFFAMRRVSGRSLAQIITSLRRGQEDAAARFTRPRLLGVFQKVCQAVSYAHARGVIHRDLKPGNVMVGEHGEVYVTDWGLCRILDGFSDENTTRIDISELNDPLQSTDGELKGTPLYMAPEQLSGEAPLGSIDGDIYALGAILYEMLTLVPLIEGGTLAEIMARATMGGIIPPRQRAPELDIPLDLEEICLKALAHLPEHRHGSAEELYEEIEELMEGSAERARRARAAEQAIQVGHVESAAYEELTRSYRDAELELYLSRLGGGVSLEGQDYTKVFSLGQRVQSLQEENASAFSSAVKRYEEALSHQPNNTYARRELARLYWTRFVTAEQRGESADAVFFRHLVETYNDGQLDAPLSGEGVLRLQTDPPGVSVSIQQYRDHDGMSVLDAENPLGETPMELSPISMGSYLVTVRAQGFRSTRVPIMVERQGRPRITVKLKNENELARGFIHVPGGPFVAGGDALNPTAGPRRVEVTGDFAIARYPVTARQYLEFVNDLALRDAEVAHNRAPRRRDGAESLWWFGSDGLFHLPESDSEGHNWHPDWPVVRVSWHDAMAYCSWLRRRLGLPMRLPDNKEWEKAARGVDGRVYPWGSRFDPSLCKCAESSSEAPAPEPVGAYLNDESPYGVKDMSGGVAEWCSGWFDESRDRQPLRGLGFEGTELECRLSYVRGQRPDRHLPHAGFRVAYSFDW